MVQNGFIIIPCVSQKGPRKDHVEGLVKNPGTQALLHPIVLALEIWALGEVAHLINSLEVLIHTDI